MAGTTGNDTLSGSAGADSIDALAGNDIVYGGTGADTISGGDGNDIIRSDAVVVNQITNGGFASSSGWTTSDGGLIGSDRYIVEQDNSPSSLTYNTALTGLTSGPASSGAGQIVFDLAWNDGNPATSSGTASFELRINGVVYARITTPDGDGSQTTVTYLNGATGPITTLFEGSAINGTGYHTITVNLPATVRDTGTLSFYTNDMGSMDDFSLDNVQVLTTSASAGANDVIDAGSGHDTVEAGGGNDSVTAGQGEDSVSLGDGDDTFTASNPDALSDTIDGGLGHDSITLGGGGSDDLVLGGAGNDTLRTSFDLDGGNDTLSGGDGRDLFVAGPGDSIIGGEGGDDFDRIDLSTIPVGANITFSGTGTGAANYAGFTLNFTEIEAITGTNSADTVNASADSAGMTLAMGGGDDSVLGGAGADSLEGGAGNDTLSGAGGKDTLVGGSGADTLTGGADADLFIVDTGGDRITDFDAVTGVGNGLEADNDVVDLSAYYNNATLAAWNSANPAQTYLTPLAWLRADQADGVLQGAGGLQLYSPDGQPVSGADLYMENTRVVCFARGTRILTPRGEVPVERLRVGMRVMTLDHGPQPIRWIGRREVSAGLLALFESLRPIVIAQGALGGGLPLRDLRVSKQHRLLLRASLARKLGGAREVLVAANHLQSLKGICAQTSDEPVEYWHFLLDCHEVIFAEGAPAETLHLGAEARKSLPRAALAEIEALFPDLNTPPARVVLGRSPACALAAHYAAKHKAFWD